MSNRLNISKKRRRRIEDIAEMLIALLDEIDGDPDLEEENEHGGDIQDEPHDEDPAEQNLGSTHSFNQEVAWHGGDWLARMDREFGGESAPCEDAEPSLGSPESSINDQEHWADGARDDREDDHDGLEPDEDFEHDPAENGIGDMDGALEQYGVVIGCGCRGIE